MGEQESWGDIPFAEDRIQPRQLRDVIHGDIVGFVSATEQPLFFDINGYREFHECVCPGVFESLAFLWTISISGKMFSAAAQRMKNRLKRLGLRL